MTGVADDAGVNVPLLSAVCEYQGVGILVSVRCCMHLAKYVANVAL